MKTDNVRLFLITGAICAILLLFGCASINPNIPMAIRYEDGLSKYYKANFEHAAHLAYENLLNCKHPALFNKNGTSKVAEKRLDILNFRMQSAVHKLNHPVCAYTTLANPQNIIWLSKDETLYWKNECRFTHVVEHEMLHLLGFNHSSKMSEILRECAQIYEPEQP